jgi:hypothetical protein
MVFASILIFGFQLATQDATSDECPESSTIVAWSCVLMYGGAS